jgi:hypothetical protein
MIVPFSRQAEAGVVLFYPSDSLMGQVSDCLDEWPSCNLGACFGGSLAEVREALGEARTVLVDAAGDPVWTADAFLAAVGRLGASCVAVYVEETREGLELLVRQHGALLLLGPLSRAQWRGFFQKALEPGGSGGPARKVA